MAKEPEVVMLTDLTLHTRDYRQTGSFDKAVQKARDEGKLGRVYSPLKKGYGKGFKKDSTFKVQLNLPPDLQEKLNRGEAVLAMPEGGLSVYAGKDTIDLIKNMNRKQRRKFLHKHPTRTWQPGEK